MKLDANSFLFTDDHTGIVYYVRTKGWTSRIAAMPVVKTERAAVTAQKEAKAGLPVASARKSSCLSLAVVLFGAVLRLFV